MNNSKKQKDEDQLARLCHAGLKNSYAKLDQALQQRLAYELAIVSNHNSSGHFLILNDLANHLHTNEIPFSAGSGRSNGSLILYALGITKLDPLLLNLSADYFFSAFSQRNPLPVWFDLPDKYQDQVFTYVKNNYGEATARAHLPGIDCVAMWHFTEALLKVSELTQTIKNNYNNTFDISTIPLDDPITFALLASGDTAGIYGLDGLVASNDNFDRKTIEQYRTNLQNIDEVKQALINFKPATFSELMIIVALFNLNPLSDWRATTLPQLIHYKRSNTPAPQPLPILQNSLKDTFGLLIYREQLHEIIMAASDFNPASAERFPKLIIRGYLNNKDTPAFKIYKKDFLTGGKANGYNDEQLQTILQFLYDGINKCTIKANTANHTLITYQMAYLKAHYEKQRYRGPA